MDYENIFETLSQSIINLIEGNLWVGPVFALAAGIFTSLTPCAMSNIPLITGYVTVEDDQCDTKKALLLSLLFAAGAAFTFTFLGLLAAGTEHAVGHSEILHTLLGILMILMAFQMWDIIHIIPHFHHHENGRKKGFIGVFLTGMIGGLFSSHCAIPVVLMLMTLASQSSNYLMGILLLLFYSIGHGIIIIVAGTSIGFSHKLENGATDKTAHIFKLIIGIFMMLIGIYMIFG